MSITNINISEASKVLKHVDIKNVKDIRALDVDLLIVLTNGDQIILSGGAVQALAQPDLPIEFANGALPLGKLFQQIEQINLSPEANYTAASKEITRYNQNNAKVKKTAQVKDEGDDKVAITNPGDNDPRAATNSQTGAGNADTPDFASIKSADNQKEIAAIEVNSSKDESWSKIWPIATGLLALLAGGGGSGSRRRRRRRGRPVSTGTAANALSLAALTPPWGSVLCHADSHIQHDECGAPEFFTAGPNCSRWLARGASSARMRWRRPCGRKKAMCTACSHPPSA